MLVPGYASSQADGAMTTAGPGNEKYLSIALLLAHSLSQGSVHITSIDDVDINPRYLGHPADIEILARHLQFAETLISTEPLASLIKPGGKRGPEAPVNGFSDLNEIKDYLRKMVIGAAHFTGSCATMPKEIGGVVDYKLRVYGCQNLRVCDASIIPILPRANTQATVYGIAELASDLIKLSI